MSKDLQSNILKAVEEYISSPEAWEDAVLVVDTVTGDVNLMEEDESDSLSDSMDIYDVMDFVRMNTDGIWVADTDAISLI